MSRYSVPVPVDHTPDDPDGQGATSPPVNGPDVPSPRLLTWKPNVVSIEGLDRKSSQVFMYRRYANATVVG
jgi:hypothetical protein